MLKSLKLNRYWYVPEFMGGIMSKPALLALADGSIFRGQAIGADGLTVGEVVFNTSMTGYQEILTDPSYAEQIITLTYPHIGNVGCNSEDNESSDVWAKGLVIRDRSLITSSWRSEQSLTEFLQKNNVIGIADIDTRRLTRLLRDRGAQSGCIMAAGEIDEQKALQVARGFPGLEGMDLAKVVTTKKTYEWCEGGWQWPDGYRAIPKSALTKHVVVYDFGVKRNILRMLVERGCHLTIISATTAVDDVFARNPDGVFLSNGPGDPAACNYAITNIQKILEKNIPLFGICLGHQLLALASGARTTKMKFGHQGANHPVQCLETGRVMISSQNHGFTVDESSLPENLQVTHKSLFDGSLQGIEHKQKPAFSFQGHPEASPGPHDLDILFDKFVKML